MDQLFDSLSEDWVSQPHSPQSEQARRSSSVASSPSQLSNPSQSRIPRFKPRTSSRLSSDGTINSRRPSSIASNDAAKHPLREKTPSNLNSFNNKAHPKDTGKSEIARLDRILKGPSTKASPLPASEETVQHKVSPAKCQVANGTPEWKRRLGGNAGMTDQPDLFSPIGLQNVFRPPTVKVKAEQKRGTKYKASVMAKMPSSPPTHAAESGPISPQYAENTEENVTRNMGALDRNSRQPQAPVQGKGPSADNKMDEGKGPKRTSSQHSNNCSSSVMNQHTSKEKGAKALSIESRPSHSQHAIKSNKGLEESIFAPSERSRITSGQTEDCNEGLSPFFVSRQQTIDGRIDYAAVVDPEQVRRQIQDLALNTRRPHSGSSDCDITYTGAHSPSVPLSQRCPSSELTSHSLPDDLSTGTESFMMNGGFVNPRRGGFSQEGSFLKKPLSPSSPPVARFEGTSIVSTARRKSAASFSDGSNITEQQAGSPSTLKGEQVGQPSSSEGPISSGSPLKLFGLYDTYTNNRLARRMSRFEETLPDGRENDESLKDDHDDSAVYADDISADPSFSEDRFSRVHGERQSSRLSSFGKGELDRHPFGSSGHFPRPQGSEHRRDADLPREGPEQFRFERNVEGSSEPSHEPPSRRKRKKHISNSLEGENTTEDFPKLEEGRETKDGFNDKPEEVFWTAHGKRLPYSPVKNPQQKRRRTLLEAELNIDHIASPLHSQVKEAPTKSMVGKKRKDALYDSQPQVADPDVLATRQILRPRNPTPSQSGQRGLHRVHGSEETKTKTQGHEANDLTMQGRSDLIIDAPTEKLAEELASLAVNVAQDMSNDIRKPSVTTADFFNEAQQIMQLIRNRGQPPSSHISEQLSVVESEDDEYDSKFLDSTKDAFSRPPSREGGSLRRVREPAHLDARVVSQLRKYEDNDDIGMALSSSLHSLKVPGSVEPLATAGIRDVLKRSGAIMDSDHNTRILESTLGSRERKQSSATDVPATNMNEQAQSFGSQSTSGPSTTRSIPTNSSRGSRNKAVIAPETVAHLLSDQVAGMTFDHERQIWVKSRSSSKADNSSKKGSASSEITDDDLLGAIPDLSVDEIEELRRTKVADNRSKSLASASDHVSNHDHAVNEYDGLRSENEILPSSRPHTADGQRIRTEDISLAPSKYSHFASSGPAPETRATSWGDEAFGRKPLPVRTISKAARAGKVEHAEEVEHEISILEGRTSQTPKRNGHRQPRVVTVAFSSPLIDQIDASYLPESDSLLPDEYDYSELEESPIHQASELKVLSSAKKPSIGFRRGSVYRSSSRRMSIGRQPHNARPMSRLDEHEELSIIHCSNGAGVNVAIATPLNTRSLLVPHSSGQTSSIGFQLSPLPDFTVHQIDRPLDRSTIADSQQLQIWKRLEAHVSLSAQEIVEKITDVEPYEPYWEYLRAIDLRNRGMLTLHMLNDFCTRLEELDVSCNQLGEVNGAPSSLRYLNARQNCLSSLSAWGHLYNLQFLNISGNQLTSLRGFQSLVHLRELNANDNQIESIEGVFALDGLTRLSLRRNQVRFVDFEESNM